MAGYTKAKIFNMALKNLGISVGIQNTAQNDRNSVVLEEFYDTAKEKTLSDHDWGFASTFRELAPTGEKSLNPKYLYEYDYPNDCLFIRNIYQKNDDNNGVVVDLFNMVTQYENNIHIKNQPFSVGSKPNGQKVIYTNVSPAIIRYTRLVEKESFFTPEFAMALSWYLAFLSSSSITGARVKMADCMQIYKQMLSEAQTVDANEQNEDEDYINEYIEARD